MLAKIWNDFCDDVLSTKKKKSKEIDFERGPVKDFLTSLGWVKYGSHCLVEQHPIQFATANHYADFDLFLQNEEKPEMIIELKRPSKRKTDKDAAQLEDYMMKEECSFGLLVGEKLELYFIDFSKPKHRAELVTNICFDKDNEEALQLFLLEEGHNLKDLISNLKSYKEAQSQIVNDMYNDCVIANLGEQQKHQCMFFHIEGDRNFTGLVANKVLGDFGKPVVVYSINEKNECTGSIRATGLDSFMDIINSTHLAECFGHENAAGIKLSADALIPLQEKLD